MSNWNTIRMRHGSGAADFDYARMDRSFNAAIGISPEHHEIHEGDHYFVVGYQDLTNGQVLDFTWQMPNTTKWTHWTWKIDTESETLWQVYEGATVVGALDNAVTPYNSNRNSANTSGTTMKFEVFANLAGANAKTTVPASAMEAGISGAGKSAGNAVREHEIVLDQNGLYCLRATANAAGYINFNMQWYEHTDEA